MLESLEHFYRSLGYKTLLTGRTLVVSGEAPFLLELSPDESILRVVALSNIEPSGKAYKRLAELNFGLWGLKLALDPEGFLAVVGEVPMECVKDKAASWVHQNVVGQALLALKEVEVKLARRAEKG